MLCVYIHFYETLFQPKKFPLFHVYFSLFPYFGNSNYEKTYYLVRFADKSFSALTQMGNQFRGQVCSLEWWIILKRKVFWKVSLFWGTLKLLKLKMYLFAFSRTNMLIPSTLTIELISCLGGEIRFHCGSSYPAFPEGTNGIKNEENAPGFYTFIQLWIERARGSEGKIKY